MLPIVVLAGGLATRLRPVTETLPKSLIPVNGIPFILHQLELFEKKEFTHIHYCLGYLGKMVEDAVRASRFVQTLTITFSYDGDKLLGTGGAIHKIINSLPVYFFITYGDSYLDIDYTEVETAFSQKKKDDTTGLMTVFANEGKWDTSNVVFEDNKILLYSKKIKDSRMKYIDYGVGILSKNNFDNMSEETTFDIADIYEKLSVNDNLVGFEIHNRFYEVGSFTGIDDISDYLKNKQ